MFHQIEKYGNGNFLQNKNSIGCAVYTVNGLSHILSCSVQCRRRDVLNLSRLLTCFVN